MAKKMLIVHGYSDGSASFTGLRDFFVASGRYRPEDVYLVDYASMDDEATYEDFADKLDTDYERLFGAAPERIDVACHSTGALVVRAWLALRRGRDAGPGRPKCPVERLLMFAPANFGSDLAGLGQSFLGKFRSTFFNSFSHKGDFMESGRVVLQGLEPASPFQWRLSHQDLHGDGFFSPAGAEDERCYPFVLAAGNYYGGIEAELLKKRAKPGTDGTVRICGTALNTRKCVLSMAGETTRLSWSSETKFDHIPFAVFDGFNHGSIVERTTPGFAAADGPGALALDALGVTDLAGYKRAAARFAAVADANYKRIQGDNRSRWQQFFFRVRDDVGQSVPDYFLDFFVVNARGRPDRDLTQAFDETFEAQFYTHSADTSHRVMMVNCDELRDFGKRLAEKHARLVFDVTAASPLPDVSYRRGEFVAFDGAAPAQGPISFLFPNTTTLVEVVLDREQTSRILEVRGASGAAPRRVRAAQKSSATGRAALVRDD
jgi:hypothetical protein